MRAVRVGRFGGPEVLEPVELPDPVPGPGQVLVEVAHADVLFLDAQLRRGAGAGTFDVRPPYVPGGAVGGRVAEVGEGVGPAWRGRHVIGRTPGDTGGYAERAVLDAATLMAVPPGLAPRDAAALPYDGPTALRLFDLAVSAGSLRPGAWVLVLAAGGGLGTLLVRLAKVAGAHVVAAAGGERKGALLRDGLGADIVVDPGADPDWTDAVRKATGGKGADLVLDGAGGALGRAAFEVVARGGRFSAHGAPSGSFAAVDPLEAAERGVTLVGIEQVQLSPAEAEPLLERALLWAANGTVCPVIGQTFPLERAAEAHAAVEAREVVGKTLLTVE
ncbi:zinc-binding dehydrogenase [Streptomyces albiaxialis]|uniref:Zinc-binding dehydrogenase n=1 Tax=Streptomyces albiaxialis TaxID=329523 RepID=A0ABN2VXH8_9ACTN